MLTNAEILAMKPGIKPFRAGQKAQDRPLSDGKPYRVQDSLNLYIVVSPKGAKRWEYRYYSGQIKTIAIGRFPKIGILAARKARDKFEGLRDEGKDPKTASALEKSLATEALRQSKARNTVAKAAQGGKTPQAKLAAAIAALHLVEPGQITVQALVEDWIASRPLGWKPQPRKEMIASLTRYVYPFIGDRAANSITSSDVLLVLRPVITGDEATGQKPAPSIAGKLIKRLINAFAHGRSFHGITSTGPADALKLINTQIADTASQTTKVGRAALVEDADLRGLLIKISAAECNPTVKAFVKMLAYTALRTDELRRAKWTEIDRDARTLTVPGLRMKGHGVQPDHVVMLSRQAMTVLDEMEALHGANQWVFPSVFKSKDAPINKQAALRFFERISLKGEMTGHGFRAIFSTLCNTNGLDRYVTEACLSHKAGTAVERAYDRSKQVELRAERMQWFADRLDQIENGAKVFQIRAAA